MYIDDLFKKTFFSLSWSDCFFGKQNANQKLNQKIKNRKKIKNHNIKID